MNCSTHRIIILAIFSIGLLSIKLESVSGLRTIDLSLRRDGRERLILTSTRFARKSLDEPTNLAPSPATALDPDESQKRRVRRGSDPIHNKCWYIYAGVDDELLLLLLRLPSVGLVFGLVCFICRKIGDILSTLRWKCSYQEEATAIWSSLDSKVLTVAQILRNFMLF